MVKLVRLDILGFLPSFYKELLRPVPIIIRLRPSDSKKMKNRFDFSYLFCVDKILAFMSIGYTVMTFKVTCLGVFAWFSTDVWFTFCRMILWEHGVFLFWNYKLLSRVWAIFWKCSTIHFGKQFSYKRLAPFWWVILLNYMSVTIPPNNISLLVKRGGGAPKSASPLLEGADAP